jgi:hypothetical protein
MPDYAAIFGAIAMDPRYLKNLDWGESRIAEIEPNLEKLRPKLSDEDY